MKGKIRMNKWKKRFFPVTALLTLTVFMASCTKDPGTSSSSTVSDQNPSYTMETAAASTASVTGSSKAASSKAAASTSASAVKISVSFDSVDKDTSVSASAAQIKLNGSSISFSGKGATVNGSKITITQAGTYVVSGTLTDGQIIVNAADNNIVRLILNGADITCKKSSPIYIKNSDKTVITLASGKSNKITDGTSYTYDDTAKEEPNASIFSKSDLTINGSGTLTVNANFNNGIAGKDDLKILGGSITVNSAGDGIKGKDCLALQGADITVTAKRDGIQSTNEEDASKGFVSIESSKLNITSVQDAIQAQTSILITGGTFSLKTGGGSANGVKSSTAESAKAVRADGDITIKGGTFDVDSSDDAVHANGNVTVSGGTLTISSGDDGIHGDSTVTIGGGTIRINKSYEGIESATVTVNNGTVYVTSSDDGINVAGGNDGSAVNGRPGQNDFQDNGNYNLYINGGYIYVDALGDGLDSNGSITMTKGTAIVNGPTQNNNGALDYNGDCKVTGGTLIAAGSAGMAQAPGTSSTQYSVLLGFDSVLPAGTPVRIETASGTDVLTFVPTKQFQTLVLSSPALKNGASYTVFYGGKAAGTLKDGVYTNPSYSGGTKFKTFTVSGAVTTVGTVNNMGGGGGGFRP